MILSVKHKFLFVHGIKTAGTSLRFALKPYSDKKEQSLLYKAIRRIPTVDQKFPYYDFYHNTHTTVAKAKRIIPTDIYHRLFKFGVVRHPNDWIVSVYKHWKRYYDAYNKIKVPKSVKTLEDFILFRMEHYAPLQLLQFIDTNGLLDLQQVGDFHNLKNFADRLSKQLNINIQLESHNVAPQQQKVNIGTKETSLIEKACELDFNVFDFENPNEDGTISVINNNNQILIADEFIRAGGVDFDPWVFAPTISKNGFLITDEKVLSKSLHTN